MYSRVECFSRFWIETNQAIVRTTEWNESAQELNVDRLELVMADEHRSVMHSYAL